MKRYRKNEIQRMLSQNIILIIFTLVLLINIIVLIIGFRFGTYSNLFLLIPVCGVAIFIALIFIIPRLPIIAPKVKFWFNKKRISQQIEVFKKEDKKFDLSLSFIELGLLYGAVKNHLIELDCYLQALAIFEEIQKNEGKALICQSIASVYEKYADYSSVKYYLELGLDFSKKIQDLSLVHDYTLLLGEFYEKLGMTEKANSYYTEADQMSEYES